MANTTETPAKKTQQYYPGTGRRKTAVAQVRLYPGKGKISVNGKELDALHDEVLKPLALSGSLGKFDISVITRGGGMTSQADAIRLGIARALVEFDESLRPTLRKSGLLTRDPREKERKKPGLKRARKAPQWQKR